MDHRRTTDSKRVIAQSLGRRHRSGMKRIAATALWFYAGLTAGSFAALVLGLSPALGPIIATAAAAIVAVDPRSLIWNRPATQNVAPFVASSPVRNLA